MPLPRITPPTDPAPAQPVDQVALNAMYSVVEDALLEGKLGSPGSVAIVRDIIKIDGPDPEYLAMSDGCDCSDIAGLAGVLENGFIVLQQCEHAERMGAHRYQSLLVTADGRAVLVECGGGYPGDGRVRWENLTANRAVTVCNQIITDNRS